MSGLAQLFSGTNFQATIRRYCAAEGWRIADINDQRAVIKFTMASGRKQTVFLTRFDSTVEFDVPSMAQFDSEDDIPGGLSTLLLRRSAQRKVGFWCIEEIGPKYVFSCMHNAEISLMSPEYFARVVEAVICECDEFEGLLIEMFG